MFNRVIKFLNALVERMTPKQLLMGTIGAGVFVFLLIFLTLQHMEQTFIDEQPEPIEMTKIVVAKTNIPRGALIKADMLKVKDFATISLPEGTTSDIETFVGLPTKLEIFADDILTENKVFMDYRQAGFIGMIPEDCRAVSIPIDSVTGIAGLVKAGDYVDVISVTSEGNTGTKVEVILQNILLLSINKNSDRELQKESPKDESEDEEEKSETQKSAEELVNKGTKIHKDADKALQGKGAEGKGLGAAGGGGEAEDLGTATLALKPDDITKVIGAMSAGQIYLALRPLKPASDSMYIRETDYYVNGNARFGSQSFLARQNQLYRPYASYSAPSVRPTPAPQPQQQPSAPATLSNGSGVRSSAPPKEQGFEVIKWGS